MEHLNPRIVWHRRVRPRVFPEGSSVRFERERMRFLTVLVEKQALYPSERRPVFTTGGEPRDLVDVQADVFCGGAGFAHSKRR